MSKWVETAIKPVPERSHILKTWPTKAGPPPLLAEILTGEGNPEAESEGLFLIAEEDGWDVLDWVEESESG